ncbi:serine hydrolase [Streptomyces sp. Ag109_O5-10]|uniref:serine hydrolase domain-containing protein n=1 Tax=Streptomyces sp. Ag109_O5-10 TaxID=1855349 RepID=UPI0008955633|nr:serine hydrolase domain-containing protein [Streptomyces sp. Ag109_O5-10]SEE44464.1 CubicO group peptidase, beta-lactamase class C family [Streptomyces sp. Ag109_O5-10]
MALDLDIDRIRELVDVGVRDKVYPGAVWAVGDHSNMAIGTPGVLDPDRPDEPMRHDTVFDVGALTQILAVWPAVGTLVEDGTLRLDAELGDLWSAVRGRPLARVTVRHLLTHTAGVPLGADRHPDTGDGVLHDAVRRPPGEAVEYTDRAALVLGRLAEELSGRPLDALAATRVWQPLGMTRTCYGPLPAEAAARCAPTELDATGSRLRGTAHGSPAHPQGGVFSVLPDLAAFLRHLLQPGRHGGQSGFGPAWVQESLRIHTGGLTPPGGLFWRPAPGTDDIWMPHGSPGAGAWLSPQQGRWAVLLTNELYYTRDPAPLARIRDTFPILAFA